MTSCNILLEGGVLSFSDRREGDVLKLAFCLGGRSS